MPSIVDINKGIELVDGSRHKQKKELSINLEGHAHKETDITIYVDPSDSEWGVKSEYPRQFIVTSLTLLLFR